MTAFLGVGCKDARDSIKGKLYGEGVANDGGWARDSTYVASRPSVLYRVIRKGNNEYVTPIGSIGPSGVQTLRLSKRGWSMLDITMMFGGNRVTPVQAGVAGAPATMRQGMWENASAPLDTIRGCPSLVPMGQVSLPAGTELAVSNYALPRNVRTLSAAELQQAILQVPLLVTPTIGISASQLTRFTRSVHQVVRTGSDPAVLLEYHDDSSPADTSAVGGRRARHIVIVMEKGVYAYRPAWTYSTSGKVTDRPILRFLDALDVDADGRSELFFKVTVEPAGDFLLAFQQWHDTWREIWRRSPGRCDA